MTLLLSREKFWERFLEVVLVIVVGVNFIKQPFTALYRHSIFFLFSSAEQAIVMNQYNAQSAGQAIGKLKSLARTQEMLVTRRHTRRRPYS
jgi:hypothetical protein